ncbi:MAG: hypothetical protein AVDCRST_MAG79-1909 [uncultured Thermoleophilia bacterium]|uniref:Uncharacterized protein n=1 Tax=uncultured Thermoleophilia bacterium TaxID=1497501 RepID=A0A6J4U8B2_9ACTN|nr:MAG: hypothetical protein AVDCRST_MAG79-1909 [uncultured Thermoleophilia bacterium]
MRDCDGERQRVLGGGVGVLRRCVAHDDPRPLGRLQVDRVEARARPRDDPEVGQAGQEALVDARGVAHDERPDAGPRLRRGLGGTSHASLGGQIVERGAGHALEHEHLRRVIVRDRARRPRHRAGVRPGSDRLPSADRADGDRLDTGSAGYQRGRRAPAPGRARRHRLRDGRSTRHRRRRRQLRGPSAREDHPARTVGVREVDAAEGDRGLPAAVGGPDQRRGA